MKEGALELYHDQKTRIGWRGLEFVGHIKTYCLGCRRVEILRVVKSELLTMMCGYCPVTTIDLKHKIEDWNNIVKWEVWKP